MENNKEIKGGFLTNGALTLVQRSKQMMKDGSYWYKLAFTNGEDLLALTSGIIADDMSLGKSYILGLNFENGKMKIVGFKEVK